MDIEERKVKKIKRIIGMTLVSSVLLINSVPAQAQELLPSGVENAKIGEQIEDFVEEHAETTVGMSVSVFDEKNIFYTGYFGYGDKENAIAMEAETVVEWGSATKLLVWVSVMQLWEQGKLDLEADVKEYLPEGYLDFLTYDAPITMRHLMNHQAGFQEVYADLFVKDKEDILPLEEALLAHKPAQIFEPGTVTAYSNWGCALAGLIVERVSGMSFADYVHTHIFQPLGMECSALKPDLSDNPWVQEKRKELQCYTGAGNLIPDCFYYITWYPAGMCTSTLEDFVTFAQTLLKSDCPLFEKESTRKEMFTPTAYLGDREIPSNYHGFWVLPYGVEVVGHGGNTAGCSSYLALHLESGIGMVVMTNQANESVYNGEMLELIFGKYETEEWFAEGRKDWEGIFRPARTMRKGPFKLMSLTYMLGEPERETYWAIGNDGVEKVCYPYGDWVDVPTWEFVLELGLVILWVIAVLFSLISLPAKVIVKLVRIFRKKKQPVPLSWWSSLAAVAQVMLIALIVLTVSLVSSYAIAKSYMWVFWLVALLMCLMVGMVIYGVRKLSTVELSKKCKFYNGITIAMLAVTVVNILYWNLFMWWYV